VEVMDSEKTVGKTKKREARRTGERKYIKRKEEKKKGGSGARKKMGRSQGWSVETREGVDLQRDLGGRSRIQKKKGAGVNTFKRAMNRWRGQKRCRKCSK